VLIDFFLKLKSHKLPVSIKESQPLPRESAAISLKSRSKVTTVRPSAAALPKISPFGRLCRPCSRR
jgi:hypothetical protein